jgi:hypothetical protein
VANKGQNLALASHDNLLRDNIMTIRERPCISSYSGTGMMMAKEAFPCIPVNSNRIREDLFYSGAVTKETP